MDEPTARTCALRHGSRFERVLERVRERPELARRIVSDAPFCRAEIVHAAREEMACSLEDVVRRRIPLVLVSRLEYETVREIAALAGDQLGWSEARRREEVESLTRLNTPAVPAR
jgi:glycerol-3-phosphate dehydrogenase